MKVRINGNDRDVPDGSSVQGLLDTLGLSDKRVAVELNRVIIACEDYAATKLSEGDVLEILSFVGGG